MHKAVTNHSGVVFETVGDAVYAAFANAIDAVLAALEAQLALGAESWPEIGQLKVRMALHTGSVELRGNHYFGAPLYRCARLMAIGYGGQTLLSAKTRGEVEGHLPTTAAVRSLGTHRLKDLAEPEDVFQLVHPRLAVDFPPLKSLDRGSTNLPPETASFVGRRSERSEVERLLQESRLLTLTGPGGTGKTRLALQVAASVLSSFDDGVKYVPLAAVSESSLVGSVIAESVGVQEQPREPLVQTMTKHLRAKELLLVLDNFEQIVAAAPLIAEVLSACPKLKVLVTSRVPLHVAIERQFAVPPLSLSAPNDRTDEGRDRADAVVLFIQRALAADPHVQLNEMNMEAL
jgi:hypothetical protein